MQVHRDATGDDDFARPGADQLGLRRAQLLAEVEPRPRAADPPIDPEAAPGVQRLEHGRLRLVREQPERVAVEVQRAIRDIEALAERRERVAQVEGI